MYCRLGRRCGGFTWAAQLQIRLEIVRKRDAHAFEVLPRRWVVERTLAWITAHSH